MAYFRGGKLSDALDAAQRAVVLDEDNAEYQRLIGQIQAKLRR